MRRINTLITTLLVGAVIAQSAEAQLLRKPAGKPEIAPAPRQAEPVPDEPTGGVNPPRIFGGRNGVNAPGVPVPGFLQQQTAGEQSRGIEKKDIRRGTTNSTRPGSFRQIRRVLIVYPENSDLPQQATQLEQDFRPVVETFNRGGKMTKADASRSPAEETAWQKFIEDLRRGIETSPADWVGVVVRPCSGAGPQSQAKQIPCPPPDCGCPGLKTVETDCNCSVYRGWCFCLLCYNPAPLQFDTTGTSRVFQRPAQGPGTESPSPETQASSGPRPVDLIVVLISPEPTPTDLTSVVKNALKQLHSEPPPPQGSGLVIKTKSIPRLHDSDQDAKN